MTAPTAKHLRLKVDGVAFDQWLSGEVTRDLKDFSGAFSFTFREKARSGAALAYASPGAPYRLRPGQSVDISIGQTLVLKGFIDRVEPSIMNGQASVMISGRDVAGDLIDCAAMTDGPAEYKQVKLEDAVSKIAQPYGLKVRNEIDTGEVFERYSIDLSETALSAIEKGTRARHALVLSDGVGGLVITRTGKTRAPARLTLPGNILASSAVFSIENRHSETIVRGTSERAGKSRGAANLDASAEPLDAGSRSAGNGSATDAERKGAAVTGRTKDDEVKRYRPVVHLARSKATAKDAQDEADWRMRTARGQSEEATITVRGFEVDGTLWTVNQMAPVSDSFLDIERDMLISKTTYREDQAGAVTELGLTSPEAFDDQPTGNRRSNKKSKAGAKGGALDGSAEAL